MKKSLLFALPLLFALSSCGSGGKPTPPEKKDPTVKLFCGGVEKANNSDVGSYEIGQVPAFTYTVSETSLESSWKYVDSTSIDLGHTVPSEEGTYKYVVNVTGNDKFNSLEVYLSFTLTSPSKETPTITITVNDTLVSGDTAGSFEEETTLTFAYTVTPNTLESTYYFASGETNLGQQVPTAIGSYSYVVSVSGNDSYYATIRAVTFSITQKAPVAFEITLDQTSEMANIAVIEDKPIYVMKATYVGELDDELTHYALKGDGGHSCPLVNLVDDNGNLTFHFDLSSLTVGTYFYSHLYVEGSTKWDGASVSANVANQSYAQERTEHEAVICGQNKYQIVEQYNMANILVSKNKVSPVITLDSTINLVTLETVNEKPAYVIHATFTGDIDNTTTFNLYDGADETLRELTFIKYEIDESNISIYFDMSSLTLGGARFYPHLSVDGLAWNRTNGDVKNSSIPDGQIGPRLAYSTLEYVLFGSYNMTCIDVRELGAFVFTCLQSKDVVELAIENEKPVFLLRGKYSGDLTNMSADLFDGNTHPTYLGETHDDNTSTMTLKFDLSSLGVGDFWSHLKINDASWDGSDNCDIRVGALAWDPEVVREESIEYSGLRFTIAEHWNMPIVRVSSI